MSHEPMPSLVAEERRAFSALALMAAGVVALMLVAVTGTILLEPPTMHDHSTPGQGAVLNALVAVALHG